MNLATGCVTQEAGPSVIERNKATRPDWTKKKPFDIHHHEDGSIVLNALTLSALGLNEGAVKAVEKANKVFSQYFANRYFSSNIRQAREIASKVLQENSSELVYSICDVYYEKRELSSNSINSASSSYDIFLCLKISSPERFEKTIRRISSPEKRKENRQEESVIAH